MTAYNSYSSSIPWYARIGGSSYWYGRGYDSYLQIDFGTYSLYYIMQYTAILRLEKCSDKVVMVYQTSPTTYNIMADRPSMASSNLLLVSFCSFLHCQRFSCFLRIITSASILFAGNQTDIHRIDTTYGQTYYYTNYFYLTYSMDGNVFQNYTSHTGATVVRILLNYEFINSVLLCFYFSSPEPKAHQ